MVIALHTLGTLDITLYMVLEDVVPGTIITLNQGAVAPTDIILYAPTVASPLGIIDGVLLTDTATLIPGTAQVSAVVAGFTGSASASLIAGGWGMTPASALLVIAASLLGSGVPIAQGTLIGVASFIPGLGYAGQEANPSNLAYTATASLIAGTTTHSSSIAGQTLADNATFIIGSFGIVHNETVFGVLFTRPTSVASGLRNADSAINGITLADNASLIPGSVFGDTAVANGATVTVTASLIGGSVQVGATANGTTLAKTASLIPGVASVSDAIAAGITLTDPASLIPGSPQASAQAAGTTLALTASLLAGGAFSGVIVPGETLTGTAIAIGGAAIAACTVNGTTLAKTASLLPGAAQGGTDASAPGQLIANICTLLPGSANGSAIRGGLLFTSPVSFIPGATVVPINGMLYIAAATLLRGSVSSDLNGGGNVTFMVPAIFLPGSVTLDNAVPSMVLVVTTEVIEGDMAAEAFIGGGLLVSNVIYLSGRIAECLHPTPVYDRHPVTILYEREEVELVVNF